MVLSILLVSSVNSANYLFMVVVEGFQSHCGGLKCYERFPYPLIDRLLQIFYKLRRRQKDEEIDMFTQQGKAGLLK